jgi:CheY-like chemotaxis protein
MCEWGKSHRIDYQFGYCRLEDIKVLVVSDRPASLCRELEAHQATALSATAIDEILASLDRFEPDGLLVDLAILNDEEIQLLISRVELVKERWQKSITIVAAIPAKNAEERRRAFRLGFAVHVSTPVEVSEMVATLASLTARIQSFPQLIANLPIFFRGQIERYTKLKRRDAIAA